MPRQLRIQYPGAVYHIMARGDRREPIVVDDGDREMFVATLAEVAGGPRSEFTSSRWQGV